MDTSKDKLSTCSLNDLDKTLWKGKLEKEKESLLIATEDKVIRTNIVKIRIGPRV